MDALFEEFQFAKKARIDRPMRSVRYDESFVLAFGSDDRVVVANQAGEVIDELRASALDMTACGADCVSFDGDTTFVLQRDARLHCGRHPDIRSLYKALFGHRGSADCSAHRLVLECFVEGRVRSWW